VSVASGDNQYSSSLPLQFPYGCRHPVAPGDNSVRAELFGDTAHRAAPLPGNDEEQVGATHSSGKGLGQRIDLKLQCSQPHYRPPMGDADHPCVATGEYPRLGRRPTRHLYRMGAQFCQWPDRPAATPCHPFRLVRIEKTGNLGLNHAKLSGIVVDDFHVSHNRPAGQNDSGVDDDSVQAVESA
jgi:hypothetical protein